MGIRKAAKVLSDIIFVSGLVVAGIFLALHFTNQKPLQAFIVSSGSMEPAIKTGSVVVVAPKKEYTLGDIVTFYSGSGKKDTSTHRVVGIGGEVVRTMGDANDQPDSTLVPRDKIVGALRLAIPFIGYVAAFAKTPHGFILLVIIPTTIIVYEELKYFVLEIRRSLKKINLSPSVSLPRAAVVLPIAFGILISISISISFFIDHETSAGNGFAVGAPAPTPTPTATPAAPLVEPVAEPEL